MIYVGCEIPICVGHGSDDTGLDADYVESKRYWHDLLQTYGYYSVWNLQELPPKDTVVKMIKLLHQYIVGYWVWR